MKINTYCLFISLLISQINCTRIVGLYSMDSHSFKYSETFRYHGTCLFTTRVLL